MAFLFGGRGRQKQPADTARSLKDLLVKLHEPSPSPKVETVMVLWHVFCVDQILQVEEDAAKYMSQMKLIIQGTPGQSFNRQHKMCR